VDRHLRAPVCDGGGMARDRRGWIRWALAAAAVASVALAGCSGDEAAEDDGGGGSEGLPGDDLALTEIQVLGSHNSYHLPAVPAVADALRALVPDLWAEIDYGHLPLTEQLEDHGIRQFELDVYADPEGGAYASPAAFQILEIDPPDAAVMAEPGFKVAHIADIDVNTTCRTFVACLTEIEAWSRAHPDHLPVMVMVETKGDDLRSGAGGLGIDVDSLGVEFATPPEMTPELYEDLEAEVRSVFDDDHVLVPDDVRGDADSLEDAVLADGWPTVGELRGKVLFALVDTGAARDVYVEDAPSLEGKLFFTSSEPGRPDAAFIRVDDSVEDAAELQRLAEAGYLIRTRTDVPGVHAVAGDVGLCDSALASGAQYLSTDYYEPFPATGYVVELPGDVVARCNPVTAPADCGEVGEG